MILLLSNKQQNAWNGKCDIHWFEPDPYFTSRSKDGPRHLSGEIVSLTNLIFCTPTEDRAHFFDHGAPADSTFFPPRPLSGICGLTPPFFNPVNTTPAIRLALPAETIAARCFFVAATPHTGYLHRIAGRFLINKKMWLCCGVF
jgi:hypothetical protein